MTSNGVFHALAHPTRRDILRVLRENDSLLAGEIARRLNIPAPTLSGHLNALKSADLISGERRGVSIRYRVNTTVVEDTLTSFLDLLNLGTAERERGEP
ncbi:metalloregulator ArsR/SmtB family transcription factor [Devriesea agamarum]|uniref:metalloregulator ArsR/SmtB family transcription factor n=1 Tax=Devriesea agamarum TaxID=472569 RepID=UPI00071DFF0A|nr:metalloregulator ArsR/SmtB family transcription factor [Devriesea agamarum]